MGAAFGDDAGGKELFDRGGIKRGGGKDAGGGGGPLRLGDAKPFMPRERIGGIELQPAPADGEPVRAVVAAPLRSEEHTSELQSLMRISYAVFCLKKKTKTQTEAYTITTLSTKCNINNDRDTHIY